MTTSAPARANGEARRWSLAALLAAVCLVAAPAPAEAHTELIASTPEDGAAVSAPVVDVVLEFSQPVDSALADVAVLDEMDVDRAQGQPRIEAATVTQPVRDLAPGGYRISYRVVSGDGHPVTGTLSFTIAAPGQPSAEPVPSGVSGGLSAVLLGAGGVAAVVAAVAFMLLARGHRSGSPSR